MASLYNLRLKFWYGESGRSYKCIRHLCGRYSDHYVDEVENYKWWLHGNMIARLDGEILTLDTCGWHTTLTQTRMNYVINNTGVAVYRIWGYLMIGVYKSFPVKYHPLWKPAKINIITGDVVEAATTMYYLCCPKRGKISINKRGEHDIIYVKTKVDTSLLMDISGLDDIYASEMVTVAIIPDDMSVYIRPSKWYRDLWFRVPEHYEYKFMDSVQERDRWIFETIFDNRGTATAYAGFLSSILK